MPDNNRASIFIFDADGVVIEPWGFAKTLKDNHDIGQEQVKKFFTGPFQACLKGQKRVEDILPSYLQQWKWNGTTSEFIALWMESENQPKVDVLELIESIRKQGYRCCLASNQERIRARFIEKEMDFQSYFDNLYFSCALGSVKPELSFYKKITMDLQVDASNIYFWDDTLKHVEGARHARWNAEHFNNIDSIKMFWQESLQQN